MIRGDASEIYALAAELTAVGGKVVGPIRSAMDTAGGKVAEDWRSNATATTGSHAKYYPPTIDHEFSGALSQIAVDIGPNPGINSQALLGRILEFGGTYSGAHLDGHRAVEANQDGVLEEIASAADEVIP